MWAGEWRFLFYYFILFSISVFSAESVVLLSSNYFSVEMWIINI